MSARYRVSSNGCGGWHVVRAGKQIGLSISHRRNAEIKAQRLNGERDCDGTDWASFYGA